MTPNSDPGDECDACPTTYEVKVPRRQDALDLFDPTKPRRRIEIQFLEPEPWSANLDDMMRRRM